jgi:hypothetical protein
MKSFSLEGYNEIPNRNETAPVKCTVHTLECILKKGISHYVLASTKVVETEICECFRLTSRTLFRGAFPPILPVFRRVWSEVHLRCIELSGPIFTTAVGSV